MLKVGLIEKLIEKSDSDSRRKTKCKNLLYSGMGILRAQNYK
jgi:hypothetical protein